MYKKFTHSFVEEQKEKPAEIITERKDEDGKSTYDVSTPCHEPSHKVGGTPRNTSFLVFSKMRSCDTKKDILKCHMEFPVI